MPQDWRKPFLDFKDKLWPLFDAGLTIGHCVVLSVDRTAIEIEPIISWLEPACTGQQRALSIPVTTNGCQFHSHLFFTDSRAGIDQLGRLVADVEIWMDAVPGGFAPAFDIPPCNNQVHRNLIRWVSLVYYLAWASNAAYLYTELEYLESVDAIGYLPWTECPQPPGCQPFDWLIHRSSAAGTVPKWKQKFYDRQIRIPDVIDAYLSGDLIAASLAAIDLLVYVLPGKRRRNSPENEPYAKRLAAVPRRQQKTERDLENLKNFLLKHHNAWTNTDIEVNFESPLTSDQIAVHVGWAPPGHGRKGQPKVSRLMQVIFGPEGMKSYRRELRRGIGQNSVRRAEGLSLLHHAIVEGQLAGKTKGDSPVGEEL